MKLKSILPPAFLVLCLAAAGAVVAMRSRGSKPPMQGFTLHTTQTAYPSNGAPIVSATIVRQQKSDGRWRSETIYRFGRTDVSFGEPGRGVFAIDDQNHKLEYLSGAQSRPLADVDWTQQPGYVGEEMILGYKTFHIRTQNDDSYADMYMCPALQGYPLRLISGNSRYKTVWEPTQVILAEPIFERTPDLPISTKRYDEKVKDLPK